METKTAFEYLINHWKSEGTKEIRHKHRRIPYAHQKNYPISEPKMKRVLLDFGWTIKQEMKWNKPKIK